MTNFRCRSSVFDGQGLGPSWRHGTVEHHLHIPCSPFQTLAKHCRVHTLPCIFRDPELCPDALPSQDVKLPVRPNRERANLAGILGLPFPLHIAVDRSKGHLPDIHGHGLNPSTPTTSIQKRIPDALASVKMKPGGLASLPASCESHTCMIRRLELHNSNTGGAFARFKAKAHPLRVPKDGIRLRGKNSWR